MAGQASGGPPGSGRGILEVRRGAVAGKARHVPRGNG